MSNHTHIVDLLRYQEDEDEDGQSVFYYSTGSEGATEIDFAHFGPDNADDMWQRFERTILRHRVSKKPLRFWNPTKGEGEGGDWEEWQITASLFSGSVVECLSPFQKIKSKYSPIKKKRVSRVSVQDAANAQNTDSADVAENTNSADVAESEDWKETAERNITQNQMLIQKIGNLKEVIKEKDGLLRRDNQEIKTLSAQIESAASFTEEKKLENLQLIAYIQTLSILLEDVPKMAMSAEWRDKLFGLEIISDYQFITKDILQQYKHNTAQTTNNFVESDGDCDIADVHNDTVYKDAAESQMGEDTEMKIGVEENYDEGGLNESQMAIICTQNDYGNGLSHHMKAGGFAKLKSPKNATWVSTTFNKSRAKRTSKGTKETLRRFILGNQWKKNRNKRSKSE